MKHRNKSLNIRGNNMFNKRIEKPLKGKGSYSRKNKEDDKEGEI